LISSFAGQCIQVGIEALHKRQHVLEPFIGNIPFAIDGPENSNSLDGQKVNNSELK
jgi:hypothetical protein